MVAPASRLAGARAALAGAAPRARRARRRESMTCGWWMSSRAMARRWRSPLDSTWSQRATSSRRGDESAEPDLSSAGLQTVVADIARIGIGIEQRAPERAERQVALLRRDHHVGPVGQRQAAARAGPQAGQAPAPASTLPVLESPLMCTASPGRSRQVGAREQRPAGAVARSRNRSGATAAPAPCRGLDGRRLRLDLGVDGVAGIDDIHDAARDAYHSATRL